MQNFWQKLPKPFLVLAPLANVTDAAFRQIIAQYSKVQGAVPYVTYTEFVSADGLSLASEEGKAKLMRDLQFTEAQRPIVAQFFTSRPDTIEKAGALALGLGFDGVDINMGCPDKSVEGQGAGARLIQTPKLAQEIIAAAKRGARSEAPDGTGIPVSVKTRLGYNKDVLEEWLPALLEARPAVVTIHARTRKEMSEVPARWERVKRAVEIRNELQKDLPAHERTLVVGNGDVVDVAHANIRAEESGADGVMLGRAIFGRPWLFDDTSSATSPCSGEIHLTPPQGDFAPLKNRLRIAAEHAELFETLLGDIKSFAIMKKHFKAYCEGFPGAKELRMQLMDTSTAAEVRGIIEDFLKRSSR